MRSIRKRSARSRPLRRLRRKGTGSRRGRTSRTRRTTLRSLAQSVETKQVTYGGANILYGSTDPSWGSGGVIPLTPTSGKLVINQGVGNGERIGNKVDIKKVVLRIALTPRPYSSTAPANSFPRPFLVKMWICSLKPQVGNNAASCVTTFQAAAFDFGTGANIGLQGNVFDTCQPMNNEAITVLGTKTYKIGRASYATGTTSQSPATTYQSTYAGWGNNDTKSFATRTWDITKMIPKRINWEDGVGAGSTCLNKAVFFVLDVIPMDNTTLATGESLCELVWRLDYHYADP